ncbi:MAG: L-fucose:H+ symporter permease [Sedimentisphaerales bacterium]|nr:L-fucose:H+ symporter permease [Sedimentisphaerales bacterium]HNY80397.1 L-fucose:H+ symporter permease [Sedimentisphaerales bacterium]HOC65272.1 L-fucose:H+ symporter permease [Sedimentisphaerales bacterium]HOH66237.1 L-fucose:H+ symporter permease [Sedimentisphaerales bacterium]HPY51383.1 L-fucose:H+ symporter permease [Sedimentisphaerales bacterium]
MAETSPRDFQDGTQKPRVIPPNILWAFVLVTSLFSLWGFANDITNPMVAAFKNILLISNFESSLVQFAFYGGYCVMAIPAALFIKRFSYKTGILLGLALYATGCLLFIPSGWMMAFWAFLISYFVMTCGLSFLETSANPYVLAMGPEETATRRLNFAQSFNPMGSLIGMLVARNFILAKLDKADEAARIVMRDTHPEHFASLQQHDLNVIIGPYMILGLVVLAVLVVFAIARLPRVKGEEDNRIDLLPTLKRLLANRKYIEGVVAQAFYVGVQIMCWTFIIQYAENELGMAKTTAQMYNMVAMVIFVSSRFVCTFLLKYFSPGGLLMTLAIGGFWLVFGTIFVKGMPGLYCLVGVSACMSLMFPTIYGIALKGLEDDAKLGAAGLIMAIGGGCLMPPMQGAIMDMNAFNLGFMTLSSTRASFVLPLICFVVIAIFGFRTSKVHGHTY